MPTRTRPSKPGPEALPLRSIVPNGVEPERHQHCAPKTHSIHRFVRPAEIVKKNLMLNTLTDMIRRSTWLARKVYLYSSSYLHTRNTDVVLAVFPKTGSTWVRYFLFNLLNRVECLGGESGLDLMNEVMPEFGHRSMTTKWPYVTCPRLIKTHNPYNALLSGHPAVLLIRDPRDVVVSYYHYAISSRDIGYSGNIKDFIYDRHLGLASFFKQYESWKSRAALTLKYEELRQVPRREFGRLVDYLKIPATESQIVAALEASELAQMRRAQTESSAFSSKLQNGFVFARSGQTQQWRGLFDDEDIRYWNELKTKHAFFLYP